MSGKINHFTQLDAWKVNHQLVLDIYEVTKDFPAEEKYGLTGQLRSAGISITNNIVSPR